MSNKELLIKKAGIELAGKRMMVKTIEHIHAKNFL